jgi:phenylacetate-CoA ligase
MTATDSQLGIGLHPERLKTLQWAKLSVTLDAVLESNTFWRRKLASAGLTDARDLRTYDDYRRLPFTNKAELSKDQAATQPFGTNLTYAPSAYSRVHQTSGTRGQPLRWLDTEESWRWWARCWATVYRAAGVDQSDRVFFAFSFGPFIGFWAGMEGAQLIGALTIPGGGMSSVQRLRTLLAHEASVLVCTPTYALHLAEVARQEGIDLSASPVTVTIHAGEPGASLPATRARIEEEWGARCYDHAGATEIGAWGFTCQAQTGLHINECEFMAEVVDPATGQPASEGELVLTPLGRIGTPVLRYRTGDRVRLAASPCPCGRTFTLLDGGVVGRVDDALVVRGVTVYPSAIENAVRQSKEVAEYSVDVHRRGELDEIELTIEAATGDADATVERVAARLRDTLGVRARVKPVPTGTLPRYDLKARRVRDHR